MKSSVSSLFAITLILCGCMSNNFVLEMLIRENSGIGNLLTCLQFIFIAIQGFFLNVDFSSFTLKTRKTPLTVYIGLNLVFVTLSVINNQAFSYNISQPVHMVFRSSSLVASLVTGLLFFRKQYSFPQITGTILVTLGVILVTSAEGIRKSQEITSCPSCDGGSLPLGNRNNTLQESELSIWMMGIGLLFVALMLSAFLGHFQEWSYRKWGKNWKEGMFYTHLLGLPYFAFLWGDISQNASLCSQSPIWHPMGTGWGLPWLWILLIANLLTQLVCIYGVYMLTGAAGTLTCTLTITIRKFLSLIVSILYFQNPFTGYHWLGSALVFAGSSYYVLGNTKEKTQ